MPSESRRDEMVSVEWINPVGVNKMKSFDSDCYDSKMDSFRSN